MSCGGKEKQWTCRKAASAAAIVAAAAAAGTINLQRVGSIVRDIGDPCLSQSPIKVVLAVNKMLKPEKWQAIFDDTGKVSSFQKALKSIILGGVDPSIRPEVWEFLLGCYSLGSTADYRRQLRTARRERFKDLIKQCQTMHSSIGTGSLAYVGSKFMDMRTSSKDGEQSGQVSTVDTDKTEKDSNSCNYCTDKSNAGQKESSKDSANLVSVGENSGNATHDSCFLSACGPYGRCSSKTEEECHGSEYITESDFDFPPLPVTDLFEKNEDEKETDENEKGYAAQHKLEFEDDNMHSFQITNNADLIMESNVSPSLSNNTSRPFNSEIELVHGDAYQPAQRSKTLSYEKDSVNRLSISDATETPLLNASRSQEAASNDKRVSEWLWTLHRIVVDVVRTDSHLDFYEDRRNLARMSDILAVYAWVDPATGYCQGMSDLLSPFIVLFEDNADAFWCFEMLIRRMRDNFQMEGPTGVMKQLQALWHILELTDREIFSHLSNIGAESLHFAFPMLLVLFRRELSFTEALRMWEMMWAADFDESFTCNLEEICLEPLVVQLPKDFGAEIREEISENGNDSVKGGPQLKHSLSDDDDGIKSMSAYPFCGLARSFWWRSDHLQICNVFSSARRGADYLPVFCVAAILIINRHKIIKETRSIDDMIKIFNDKLLKIHVKRCIGAAIKLRKKYFYKLVKNKGHSAQHSE